MAPTAPFAAHFKKDAFSRALCFCYRILNVPDSISRGIVFGHGRVLGCKQDTDEKNGLDNHIASGEFCLPLLYTAKFGLYASLPSSYQ